MTRFLRMTALILTSVLLLSVMSSCDLTDKIKLRLMPNATEAPRGIPEDNDSEFVSLTSDGITYSSYYTPVRNRHSYALLSKGQQALYDALYTNVREVYPDTDEEEELYKTKQVIIDDYLLTSADIRVAAKALYDDNPELFWLSSTIYQLTDSKGDYTAVQMRSIYSPDEIRSMQGQINTAVNEFFAQVPAGMSEYEREKYVHDYICNICEYDNEAAKTHATSERIEEAYMIYGALVLGKAVCEGYARTLQLLLTGIGVDCVGVTGLGYDSNGDNELHMWNAVVIDGDWYYVDPTWDDQLYDYRRYQYFNLDEKTMNLDHEPSRLLSQLSADEINGDETFSAVAMNIFLPECTADYYQYYVFECPHLTDYSSSEVEEGVYRAALNQEPYVTIYVDADYLDYNYTMAVLFRDQPQYFFTYLNDVNSWLSGYEIDDSNLTYYTNEARSAFTVELNYY